MNREIKFKIWDNHTKVMSKEFELSELIFSWDVIWTSRFNGQNEISGCDIVFCQYTGLKDRNGNDIYEGDIVEAWSEGYKHIGEIRWRFEGQPAIIIYPAFANQGFWKLHGQKGIDDGVVVIGNIFQNPEILSND